MLKVEVLGYMTWHDDRFADVVQGTLCKWDVGK